jgi:hypothetical protein
MAWFWWFYAMAIATWSIAAYRRMQAMSEPDASRRGIPDPATAPMTPGTRMLTMLATNLMLFSAIIFLAWSAHDRMTAGMTVGVMLTLSVWHFFRSRGKAGMAAGLAYIAQLASSCVVLLAIFNLRFDTWAANWYGVDVAEIHHRLPTRMVPLLTLALVLWAGMLLVLTRSKSGSR